jgi:ketosteroid isomerase-like protein
MSELEEFLSQMLPRYIRAVDAMHNGDPALFVEVWSRRNPVTLLAAAASAPAGWESVIEAQRSVASLFSNGTPLDFELIAAEVNGELAYTVGYERCSVSAHGGPAGPVFLRATQIYRPGERRVEARAPPRRSGNGRQCGDGRTQRHIQSKLDDCSAVAAVARHPPAAAPAAISAEIRVTGVSALCVTQENTLRSATAAVLAL